MSVMLQGWVRTWAWRLGLHPAPPSRGVLVVADAAGDVLGNLLERLREDHPRINLYQLAVSGAPAHPLTRLLPPPPAWRWAVRRFLNRLKIQAIVVAGDPIVPRGLLHLAADQGISLINVGIPGRALAGLCGTLAVCRVDAGQRDRVIELGVPPARVVEGDAEPNLYQRTTPLLVSARAPGKTSRGVESWLLARMSRAPLSWVTRDKFEPLASLAALAERLGHPDSILCLGNGPSSDDPALDGIHCDAVFRVNHLWLNGSRHTRPDVIFTGKKDTLSAYPRPVLYAFQTEAAAERIMLRSLLVAKRMAYVTAERLGCLDFDTFGPYKPTNGAVMIATAAALRPRRLVVAGMDLFSDPRGSYPGQSQTPNAYTVAHDRDVEARFILATLAAFPGEVVVVGDVLKERWQRYLAGAPSRRQDHTH